MCDTRYLDAGLSNRYHRVRCENYPRNDASGPWLRWHMLGFAESVETCAGSACLRGVRSRLSNTVGLSERAILVAKHMRCWIEPMPSASLFFGRYSHSRRTRIAKNVLKRCETNPLALVQHFRSSHLGLPDVERQGVKGLGPVAWRFT